MGKPYCTSYHSWERFGGSAPSHGAAFPRGFSLGPAPGPPWVQTEAQGSASAFPGWARRLAFIVTTVATMQRGVLVHRMLAFSPWDLFLLSTGIYQISTVCPRSQHWVPVSLSFFFGWKDQISFHIWTVLGKIKDSLSLDNFRCYSCSKYWPSPLLLPPFPHDTVARALATEK